jgi:hypothetical protein
VPSGEAANAMEGEPTAAVRTMLCCVLTLVGVIKPAERVLQVRRVDSLTVIQHRDRGKGVEAIESNVYLHALGFGIESIPYEFEQWLPRLDAFEMFLDALVADLCRSGNVDVFGHGGTLCIFQPPLRRRM